jgi:nitrogen fixation-related uncharacterized protein
MWTLRSGQYDDLEGAAHRILFDGNDGPLPDARHSPAACQSASSPSPLRE